MHTRSRQQFFKHLLRNYNTQEANFFAGMDLGLASLKFVCMVPKFRKLVKICLHGSEIPNMFRTGSEKPQKIAKSFKTFYRTTSARDEKNSFEIYSMSILKFVLGHFL
jgi:hypothetical protein